METKNTIVPESSSELVTDPKTGADTIVPEPKKVGQNDSKSEGKAAIWGPTFEPGIRQRLSSKIWFINKSIGGRTICESLQTKYKTLAVEEARKRLARYREQINSAEKDTDPTKVIIEMALKKYRTWIEDQVATGHLTKRTLDHKVYALGLLERTWNETPDLKAKGKVPFAELNPKKISLEDCEAWFKQVAVDGYNPHIRNVMVGMLRHLLSLVIENWNPTVINHAMKLKKVSEGYKREWVPSEDEWAQIVAVMRDPSRHKFNKDHAADLIEALAWTGMRLEECTEVRKDWVNLEKGEIRVPADFRKGKIGEKVPLTAIILPKAKPLFERLVAEADPETGRIFHVKKAHKTLKNACKLCKFPLMKHHTLRKFFVTRCAAAGLAPSAVALLIGQKDGGFLASTVYPMLRTDHLEDARAMLKFGH